MAGTREHVISVEETEAGETSSGRDISCLHGRITELKDQEACELKKRFEKLSQAGDHSSLNTPKIQKVPQLLQGRRQFKKYFKPRITALGPIHHGKKEYQPAEEYKLRMTNCFVKESGKDAEFLYNVVETKIKQLRLCFDEKVTEKCNDQKLAWMLFVDGCAILQFIHCAVDNKCKCWKMKYDLMAFWKQDLFLLENQLPYQLLVDLKNFSAEKGELEKSIKTFMPRQTALPEEEWSQGTTERDPNHLLDLLRTISIGAKPKSTPGEKSSRRGKSQSYYRNVDELRAAGIHVMPPRKRNGSLTTITCYEGLNFYLRLSPIIVHDSTGPKFLNLIDYEMCPDFENEFEITSYISFLDSLIDNANDVRELRKAGILQNHLGSDEEVALLFNEIGSDLVPDSNAYREVKAAIQSLYDTKWKTWIDEFVHEHFRSPWTVMAFSAAIIVLGLTFIQTWFSFKEDRSDSRPPVRR
ncbi:hypothetical protein CIPAW_09G045200 [Carya illinoinensis]|uniref:Uncharacterized protein n=1 Tax=Carya illinoinensis TaxID=32201 RepID=A0A8T1PH23_CARIL|nr:hypothetical protein CIPAW_09G045200 [Carya illinoinensis]